MTREQAIAELRAIRERQGDRRLTDGRVIPDVIRERDHEDADEILLQLIDDADVRAAFESIGKWYA